jgi:hypothetical protein
MNPSTFTVQYGRELFVYVRGQLVMKRWLDTGRHVVFHTYGGVRWNTTYART